MPDPDSAALIVKKLQPATTFEVKRDKVTGKLIDKVT